MSGNTNRRIEEIVSEIRAKVARQASNTTAESAQPAISNPERTSDVRKYTAQLKNATASLGRLDDTIGQAGSRIGSCPPSPPTARGRLGAAIIEQLSKLLWWQSLQVRETVSLIVRRNREQTASTELAIDATNRLGDELTSLRQWVEGELAPLRGIAAELPVLRSRIESTVTTSAQLGSHIGALSSQIDELSIKLVAVAAKQDELTQGLTKTATLASTQEIHARLDTMLQPARDAAPDIIRITETLSSLSDKVSDLGLAAHRLRADVSAQEARVGRVLRQIRTEQPLDQQTQPMSALGRDESLDRLYVDFESIFRGTREQIRERQRIYLPILRSAGIEGSGNLILDLGCGRGEWLEELRQHGFQARGADTNTAMLADCRQSGLDVVEGDALQHLAALPDRSLAAITSFHMIEHMQFREVITLLDQALRVLRPAGILILETPNPGNLAVGASTFYLDPTHVRPIPSPLLQFVAEGRGFVDTQVLELHPYPDSVRLPEETAVGRRFNECIYGPQDYALIARRP